MRADDVEVEGRGGNLQFPSRSTGGKFQEYRRADYVGEPWIFRGAGRENKEQRDLHKEAIPESPGSVQ